jgi:hypothetical protein
VSSTATIVPTKKAKKKSKQLTVVPTDVDPSAAQPLLVPEITPLPGTTFTPVVAALPDVGRLIAELQQNVIEKDGELAILAAELHKVKAELSDNKKLKWPNVHHDHLRLLRLHEDVSIVCSTLY